MKIHGISKVEIIEVIKVSISAGGGADESDPIRPAFQYWSKDGELLAKNDPYLPCGNDAFEAGKPHLTGQRNRQP